MLMEKFDISTSPHRSTYFSRLAAVQTERFQGGSFQFAKEFLSESYTDVNFVTNGRSALDHFAERDNRELIIELAALGGKSANDELLVRHIRKFVRRADVEVVSALLGTSSSVGNQSSQFCASIGYSATAAGQYNILAELLSCSEVADMPIAETQRSQSADNIAVGYYYDFSPYWINFTDGTYGTVMTSAGRHAYRASVDPQGFTIAIQGYPYGPIELYSIETGEYRVFASGYHLSLLWQSADALRASTYSDRCMLYLDGSANCSLNEDTYSILKIFNDGVRLLSGYGSTLFEHPNGQRTIALGNYYTRCTMASTEDRSKIVLQPSNNSSYSIGVLDVRSGTIESFVEPSLEAGCPIMSKDESQVAFYTAFRMVEARAFPGGETIQLKQTEGMGMPRFD